MAREKSQDLYFDQMYFFLSSVFQSMFHYHLSSFPHNSPVYSFLSYSLLKLQGSFKEKQILADGGKICILIAKLRLKMIDQETNILLYSIHI